MERNSARANRMKSDRKLFFCQMYAIFGEKMEHVVINMYFSLFLKGLKIFLNLMLSSLIVPLMHTQANCINMIATFYVLLK